MLLITHAIALTISLGKAVIANNPLQVNTAMILRVFQLTLNIFKDEVNYNHRVLIKTTLEQYKARLEQSKYIVIGLENIYYTANYQRLTCQLQKITDEFALKVLHSYKDKEFKSVSADDLGLENTEKKEEIKAAEKKCKKKAKVKAEAKA